MITKYITTSFDPYEVTTEWQETGMCHTNAQMISLRHGRGSYTCDVIFHEYDGDDNGLVIIHEPTNPHDRLVLAIHELKQWMPESTRGDHEAYARTAVVVAERRRFDIERRRRRFDVIEPPIWGD